MSDYNNQYPPQGYGQQPYGSPAPQQYGGYQSPAPQQYGQPDYSQQQYGGNPAPYGSPAPPQQGSYGAPPQPGYYDASQQGQYGPPQNGGYQHGQVAPQGYGADYSQQSNYSYGQEGQRDQYPGSAPAQQYPQQGPYGSVPADPNSAYGNPNYDPNAAPGGAQEGERGLMGAIGGGLAGHYGGKKMGHGVIGALAGAFLGHKAEDAFKDRNKHKHSGSSSYGGSTKW